MLYQSKRRSSVQTCTFGVEFLALRKGVEDAGTLGYYLRSMDVQVTKPTAMYVDNQSVFLNSTVPGSLLNKKAGALSYQFVQEHNANGVISVYKIKSEDNYADPLTKGMNSTDHGGFFHNILHN